MSEAGADALTREQEERLAQVVGEVREKVGSRRFRSGAPVRRSFVVGAEDGSVPPLAALLRGGGRGGQVRLKTYLSLLWVSAAPPFETAFSSRGLAALLGLEDPETRGRRRVQVAVRDLAERRLIETARHSGLSTTTRLLREDGSGEPYSLPSTTYNRLNSSGAGAEELRQHLYFKIPSAVWTSGSFARLSGAGVAMMLVLLAEYRRTSGDGVWFSPDRADRVFQLAPVTRTKGLKELRRLNLVKVRQQAVSERGGYLDVQRWRNVYTLTLDTPEAAGASERPAFTVNEEGLVKFAEHVQRELLDAHKDSGRRIKSTDLLPTGMHLPGP